MAITNGYITLAELQAVAIPTNVSPTSAGNTKFEYTIEAASRLIDKYTGRRFYNVPETRYYTSDDIQVLETDDFTSVNALKTDTNGDGTYETTWNTTDYNLWPYNASLDGKPYMAIEVAEGSNYDFGIAYPKGVLLSANFGYVSGTQAATAAPDLIHQACLMISLRYLERKNTILGIAGNLQLGEKRVLIPDITLDPDIKTMLDGFRRF